MGEAILLTNEEVPLIKLRKLMKEVADEAYRKSEKADKLLRDKIIRDIKQMCNKTHV